MGPVTNALGRVLFWAWLLASVVVGGSLLAAHWVALPIPAADDERLDAALAALRGPEDADRWLVVHVLYAACECSARVVEHLADDPRPQGVVEKVVWIGNRPELEARLDAAGFAITRVAPTDLTTIYAIESAPLLLVVDGGGTLRYRGGYTDRKQSLAIQDVAIVEQLVADGDVPALPLFGCAVSRRLRDMLDPLGLRSDDDSFPDRMP